MRITRTGNAFWPSIFSCEKSFFRRWHASSIFFTRNKTLLMVFRRVYLFVKDNNITVLSTAVGQKYVYNTNVFYCFYMILLFPYFHTTAVIIIIKLWQRFWKRVGSYYITSGRCKFFRITSRLGLRTTEAGGDTAATRLFHEKFGPFLSRSRIPSTAKIILFTGCVCVCVCVW